MVYIRLYKLNFIDGDFKRFDNFSAYKHFIYVVIRFFLEIVKTQTALSFVMLLTICIYITK